MRAFLLAAGHGTRLRPHTDSLPKCLLPVRGTPILEIWLELCRIYGVSDVLVNTHAHAGAVAQFVRRQKNGIRIKLAQEPQLFGSAGTLLANRDWVINEDKFWVFYADVLTNVNLRSMLRRHSVESVATLGIYSVPDPQRCGIVSVDRAGISNFVEKPAAPESNLAFSGILIGTQKFLDAIPEKPGADIAFDVLPHLVGRMQAYRISEYLLDIGTLENYQLAQQTWPGLDARSAS